MKKILFFPYNGNAMEAIECLDDNWEFIGFIDDNLFKLKKRGLKLLIIRPTSIYGYGQQDKTFLVRYLNKIKANQKLIFFRPLSMKLNFIHAGDVSNAIIHLIRKNRQGVYNLAHEKNISKTYPRQTCRYSSFMMQ